MPKFGWCRLPDILQLCEWDVVVLVAVSIVEGVQWYMTIVQQRMPAVSPVPDLLMQETRSSF